MPTIQEGIVIDRPQETVFDYSSDPSNVPRYSPSIVRYEQLDTGPLGLGSRIDGSIKVAGKRLDFVYEIVEFDPPRRFSGKTLESPIPFRITIWSDPFDGGTLLEWLTETDLFGGFFGKLAEPVVVGIYTRQLRADLERLKRMIEAET
jgi:ligand-binding SRPBCC domain-containing protein